MHESQIRAQQPHAQPPHADVREQLARILSSDLFARSERLSAFLRFIVEQTLNGQGETLKEQVIAVELYCKGPDFNTAGDPIVRVDARRLRDKLREYYASARDEPIVISVPKGSYTPLFEIAENGMPSVETAARSPAEAGRVREDMAASLRWFRLWVAVAALVLLVVGWIGVSIVRSGRSEPPAPRLFTVTAFPGWEGHPSIAPDGNFVVFARSEPDFPGINDLWMSEVDGDALRRLTDTPDLHEVNPVWSPDGRQIAFGALDGTASRGVFVMSAHGGQATKVAEGSAPAWLPDGRSLVVNDRLPNRTLGLFQHVIATGTRRQLTWPTADLSDVFPAVSPDGATLAFVRLSRRSPRAAVFLLPLSGGEPKRRTDWVEPTAGLAWTPDGRELLYSSADASGLRMYRISAFGTDPGRPVRDLPLTAGAPSSSRARSDGTFRLAFVYGMADVGLRLVDLHAAAGKDDAAASPFCDSARMDTPGRFSRDGAHAAFTSNRSGSPQVWVASRDCSAPRALTVLEAASINVGSWSPDGRAVAFDAVVNGNADIYVALTEGGPLHRLTDAPSIDSDPEWSADGRWIYYVSDASGRSEIWRMPAAGGQATQITTGGGFEPREASDGRMLYYVDRARRPEGLGAVVTLKQVPAAGGEERFVLSGVRPGTWDITDRGIIFFTAESERPTSNGKGDALALYDFADGRVRQLTALPFRLARFRTPRLAASRDGRWVLANHLDAWERDIMVADNCC